MSNPRKNRKLKSKIYSVAALSKILKSKKRVVFTNGCFDLLHKGHVTYLEHAKKQGLFLVVALNADNSVRKLKGPGRPLNSLADRLDVIAALESVDFVTWFDEETPLKTILKLRPTVLIKGGDWPVGKMVGATEVLGWGGQVRSLKYIAGKSTTDLIKKAKQRK